MCALTFSELLILQLLFLCATRILTRIIYRYNLYFSFIKFCSKVFPDFRSFTDPSKWNDKNTYVPIMPEVRAARILSKEFPGNSSWIPSCYQMHSINAIKVLCQPMKRGREKKTKAYQRFLTLWIRSRPLRKFIRGSKTDPPSGLLSQATLWQVSKIRKSLLNP